MNFANMRVAVSTAACWVLQTIGGLLFFFIPFFWLLREGHAVLIGLYLIFSLGYCVLLRMVRRWGSRMWLVSVIAGLIAALLLGYFEFPAMGDYVAVGIVGGTGANLLYSVITAPLARQSSTRKVWEWVVSVSVFFSLLLMVPLMRQDQYPAPAYEYIAPPSERSAYSGAFETGPRPAIPSVQSYGQMSPYPSESGYDEKSSSRERQFTRTELNAQLRRECIIRLRARSRSAHDQVDTVPNVFSGREYILPLLRSDSNFVCELDPSSGVQLSSVDPEMAQFVGECVRRLLARSETASEPDTLSEDVITEEHSLLFFHADSSLVCQSKLDRGIRIVNVDLGVR